MRKFQLCFLFLHFHQLESGKRNVNKRHLARRCELMKLTVELKKNSSHQRTHRNAIYFKIFCFQHCGCRFNKKSSSPVLSRAFHGCLNNKYFFKNKYFSGFSKSNWILKFEQNRKVYECFPSRFIFYELRARNYLAFACFSAMPTNCQRSRNVI